MHVLWKKTFQREGITSAKVSSISEKNQRHREAGADGATEETSKTHNGSRSV